jgi:CBS domain-containing protein
VSITVAEIMNREPQTIQADRPVAEAAERMRSTDVGALVVLDGDRLVGILTDRDIVVRVLADNKDGSTPVREACSGELTVIYPDTQIDTAAALMRERLLRRLPVVEGGDRLVGVVSIGDLAIDRDERSALADISAAPPNR